MTHEFDNTRDFILEVDKIIVNNYFEHYFLINSVSMVGHYQLEYFDSYLIGDSKNWIVGFWLSGNYFIYGKDWTESQINELKKRIDFSIYEKGFHFNGTEKLISQLTENVNHSIFKERLYYSNVELTKISDINNIAELGILENLDEITQMTCDYFEEEYKGLNNKEFDAMKIETDSSLKNNSIWILRDNNEIVSMCSIINTTYNFPIIGSLFTKKKYRNKGFGTKLLQDVTIFLKDKFDVVNLLAEKNNIESNIVFQKLNYKIVYETKDIEIE